MRHRRLLVVHIILANMRWIAEMTMISFSHMQMLYTSAYRDHFRLAIEEDGHKYFARNLVKKLFSLLTDRQKWLNYCIYSNLYKQMRIAFAYG